MSGLVTGLIRLFTHIPMDLIALLARISVGAVFFKSGLTKIDTAAWAVKPSTFFLFESEYKIRLFHDLGLTDKVYDLPRPELFAYAGTFMELTMPLLLWIGFASRFAALALLGMTLVIETVYPQAYDTHGLWAVALLFLMKYGAGHFSVDYLIRRR